MLIIYFSIYFLSCGMSDQPWLYRFVCWCWSRIHKVYLVGSATPDNHIHKFVLYYSESEVSITICFMLEEWFHLINWHFKQVPCSCYTLSPALIFIKNEAWAADLLVWNLVGGNTPSWSCWSATCVDWKLLVSNHSCAWPSKQVNITWYAHFKYIFIIARSSKSL